MGEAREGRARWRVFDVNRKVERVVEHPLTTIKAEIRIQEESGHRGPTSLTRLAERLAMRPPQLCLHRGLHLGKTGLMLLLLTSVSRLCDTSVCHRWLLSKPGQHRAVGS